MARARAFVRGSECLRHFARRWLPTAGTCAAGCKLDIDRMLCAAGRR